MNMVGQVNNINKFKSICQNKIPNLIIIEGQKSSGRTFLAKEFCNIANSKAIVLIVKGNIDNIREMIDLCYKTNVDKFYIIEDFTELSFNAQSALLKIFEEPPKHCNFIITIKDKFLLLDTILSRGILFEIEPYTKEELSSYSKDSLLVNNLFTPGQINYWKNRHFEDFLNFTNNFYIYLQERTGVYCLNELKNNICYDEKENKIYYRHFIDFLHRKIYKDFRWNNEDLYNKFIITVNNFYKKDSNNNNNKEIILTNYIIKLKGILNDTKRIEK